MGIEITGLDELERWAAELPGKMEAALDQTDRRASEMLVAMVKANTPVGVVNGGRTRESIYARRERSGSLLETAVTSDNPVLYFLEFGTGPVAASAGYPGETNVPHVTEGWTYWSDYAAQQRAAQQPGDKPNGYVYTRGQPPRAMLYNAAKAFEPELERMMTEAVKGAIR